MKYLILSIFILFYSCASVNYDANSTKDFTRVENGKTYVIWAKNDFRKRVKVNYIDNDSVKGYHKNEYVSLHKNDIKKIRKNNTAATIAVSYYGAGTLLFLAAVLLFKNSPKTGDN